MDAEKHYLGIPRRLIPWHPSIDEDACTGCGVCVNACKHGVYGFDDGEVVVANPYECEVYCQSCQFQCEMEAIFFPDKEAVKAVFKGLRKQYPPR